MTYPKLTPVEFVHELRKETRAHVSNMSMSIWIGDSNLGKFIEKYGGASEENATEAVLDQLMTIFYRLTQKPVGSLVPLKDLLDKIETPYPVHQPKANARLEQFFKDYLIEMLRKTEFPFKYHASAAAFEREDNLTHKIIAIKNVEAVLEGKCPHCIGNLSKEQVDNFSVNRTITCSYCNYSIKAEWISR
jgi:hypothetical protein